MKSMIDVALDCIRRGWYVFPCFPNTKKPMTDHGFKDASNLELDVRRWWKDWPNANVAIATGPSGLCVMDLDHGIAAVAALDVFFHDHPTGRYTYMVRTGRRPEFGVQVYYQGTGLKSTGWKDGDISGDIRCSTGYVMAAGSVHPSGERYTALNACTVQPVPEWVKTLTVRANDPSEASTVDNSTAEYWKTWLLDYASVNALELTGYEKRVPNGWWLGIVCPWALEHTTGAGADSSTVLGILDGKIAFECSHGTCKYAHHNTAYFLDDYPVPENWTEPGADVPITLGSGLPAPKAAPEPDTFFDTADQIINAEPVDFIVNSVIPKNRYTGFVALSGSRKTIIACNLIRSVLTGEPFLGRFAVDCQPERVLFFAAESARSELKERFEGMSLVPFLRAGKLLVRSAATSGSFHQDQLPEGLVRGALVVFDTFIRFFDGTSEQDSTEARKFSAQMQRIVNLGATVIVLFHAPKGARETDEMTIETIRGSSELGASMAACWGLSMLGPDWKDNTRMTQVKRREFECKPPIFDFSCDMQTAICQYVEKPAEVKVGTAKTAAAHALALDFRREHPDMKDRELADAFQKGHPEIDPPISYKWFQRHKE